MRQNLGQYIWVVESQFSDGYWAICDFCDIEYADTNFYMAHHFKRMIYSHLKNHNAYWTKDKFRVKKYK